MQPMKTETAKPALHPVQRDRNARTHLIATVGHKWIHAVVLDYPVRLAQLPLHDHGLQPMTFRGEPYPLKRAVRMFRRYAKEHGVTEGAQHALDALKASLPAETA
jgi:hypothetical protein